MRCRFHPNVVWLIAIVAAFAAGYFDGGSAEPRDKEVSPAAMRSDATVKDGVAEARHKTGKVEPAEWNGRQLSESTLAVFTERNPVQRMSRLVELLPSVNAANWRDALDLTTRRKDGGLSPEELRLLLMRIGEVAGSSAIEQSLGSQLPDAQARALAVATGWAAASPAAAAEWYRAQKQEQQEKIVEGIVSGLAMSSPADALAIYVWLSFAGQSRVVNAMLDGVIQRGGFPAADELLAAALTDSKAKETLSTRRELFNSLLKRRIDAGKASGDPLKALGWMERYFSEEWLDRDAPYQAAHSAAEMDPAITMTWLDAHAGRLPDQDAYWALRATVDNWFKKAPDQFVAWTASNRGHPKMRDIVYSVSGIMLARGKLDEARRRANEIGTPAARMGLESAIANHDAIQKQRELMPAGERPSLDQTAPAAR